MKTTTSMVLLALFLAMVPAAFADITSAYNVDLASPGVYFGSGNSNGHFSTTTEVYDTGGITVALRGAIAYGSLITPTDQNDYACSGSQACSFQWSVATTGALIVGDFNYLITIKDLTSHKSLSFDPSSLVDNDYWTTAGEKPKTPFVATATGFQNSEQLGSFLLKVALNWHQADQVAIYFSATSKTGLADPTVAMGLNTAVPEPAAIVVMSCFGGLLGIGSLLRRRINNA